MLPHGYVSLKAYQARLLLHSLAPHGHFFWYVFRSFVRAGLQLWSFPAQFCVTYSVGFMNYALLRRVVYRLGAHHGHLS